MFRSTRSVLPKIRRYYFELDSITLSAVSLPEYDCLVLVTDHNAFDYDMVEKHTNLLVDTLVIYQKGSDKIIKA